MPGTVGEAQGRPFRKGQSGNPGGRPKRAVEIQALARRHTSSAIATLLEIATRGASESARVAAANALLDRGWGKPGSAVLGANLPDKVEFTIMPLPGSAAAERGLASRGGPRPGTNKSAIPA
ncbi:MAG: DUF5681 domain-containing protein [Acetobacteraceae bacterium]